MFCWMVSPSSKMFTAKPLLRRTHPRVLDPTPFLTSVFPHGLLSEINHLFFLSLGSLKIIINTGIGKYLCLLFSHITSTIYNSKNWVKVMTVWFWRHTHHVGIRGESLPSFYLDGVLIILVTSHCWNRLCRGSISLE